MQPRLTALYGDDNKSFSYSGITMKPYPWTEALIKIKQKIEIESGVVFTTALLNYYRNEKDSMGWHRDNEKELGPKPVIGSVSFGATREFQLRHYYEKNLRTSVELNHGSFLLMKNETQHHWEHAIPKKNKALDERINITFRVIN
jgi:alkylated DNA repair dioxygenase AlkB